ncbi:CtsR family transcriptional regulator [Oscillospiraceae bacterium DSM 107454]|uniref:CtsR family transcriptional regulator n=2 Tax=Ructibacterium gallinarum TaxID=2779355 RepID=A0A9D5R7Y3_9FIRM|nr:CtsR family transcriptional regulator [Ructibacterium gallinarum]
MMSEQDGEIELKRNELANRFHCVPSQINYVISTRFSPERGYIVESRRGGGGYIRITRVSPKSGSGLMHVVNAIGENLSYADAKALIQNCYEYDWITQNEAKIMLAALSERSIPVRQPEQDVLRAKMLKNILIALV